MGTTNGNNNNSNNIEIAQLKVFPNPFTYDLTLQFALPKTENVTIGLYDMQGRLVQNILDAQQSEGVHTIYINGQSLPAGMYLCKLMTPTTEINKKIIKTK